MSIHLSSVGPSKHYIYKIHEMNVLLLKNTPESVETYIYINMHNYVY